MEPLRSILAASGCAATLASAPSRSLRLAESNASNVTDLHEFERESGSTDLRELVRPLGSTGAQRLMRL
jgi:hypothetical protein